ncbi:protein of unknown function (plasmid) [Cupriavidus neocaledonicus]|uniref:Uncharacterized protein n=1 Tax=Cupriavidus neocaledonicus TaxID=1040979 RepID=A0A375HQ16_9BURK|nr:protein of unknown function [Cupriavidus neocaledonicus]
MLAELPTRVSLFANVHLCLYENERNWRPRQSRWRRSVGSYPRPFANTSLARHSPNTWD